jgi:hypothetical protein
MNPTKPVDPAILTEGMSGLTVAGGLDRFVGAAGGGGIDLKSTGLPWIQYVRLADTNAGTHTVIDAIAAVDPAVVGDALSISPADMATGMTNLLFQNPARTSTNLVAVNFDSVSGIARVFTVGLNDFSSFAPVMGRVSSAYQVSVKPMPGGTAPTYVADIGLRAGDNYSGDGGDLRVYEWSGTNWALEPFSYDAGNNEVLVQGLTNLSAFVVSQLIPPQLSMQKSAKGFAFQFVPWTNCPSVLERSTNFVTWTQITTFTATNGQAMTLEDTNVPPGKSFYRLRLNP